MSNLALSIIIPAYNEAERIGVTIESLRRYLCNKNFQYEIIVVDDGSNDGTPDIVRTYQSSIPGLRVLENEKNRGKGYSVRHGMSVASGAHRLFMDADNSVDILHLDMFLPWMNKGFDITIGSIRTLNAAVHEKNGWHRRVLGDLSKFLIRAATQLQVKDTQRGFKLFSAQAAETIFPLQTIERFGFDIELLVIAKENRLAVKELPVAWVNPGGSKVSLTSYVHTLWELFTIIRNRVFGKYSVKINKFLRFDSSKTSYKMILIFLGIISLFLLILIKSKTVVEFQNDPMLFVYSIFVTTFIFSRLFSSLFYNHSLSKVIDIKNSQKEEYEPLVSFVIPCKNEAEAIYKTITQCFESDYPKNKLEVIVINDGSTDNTMEVLKKIKRKYKNLIIVNWKINKGKRYGMAEGFRISKGEIIIQLDSDSYIEPKTFRNLIKPFQNLEIAAVCAHADPTNANKNFITKMQAAYYFMSFRILKAAESVFMSVFCCSGCSSAYRKSVVLPILDEWLNEMFLGKPVTWGDDRALTSWILKLGHKVIYTDKVKAFTIVPDNVRQLFKQQLRWKKSWIINGIFTSRFIYKQHLFMALFYFFPLLLISFLTPFMVFRAMIYSPIAKGTLPIYYILGSMMVTTIIVIFYRLYAPKNKHWLYLYAWSFLNIIIFSYIIIYAAIRIQDRGWGTR
ncbi:MAG: glycosyltransferase [bacterium]|nr:glycosyltransferase [bacterium]